MSDLNKVISLFIGLFVVIFIVAFALGKINIGGKKIVPRLGGALAPIFNIKTPAPTPSPTAKTIAIKKTVESKNGGLVVKPTGAVQGANDATQTTNSASVPTGSGYAQIPKTGPEMIFPLALISFFIGVFLRRRFS